MRKPAQRLGTNGIQEIKGHEWFKDFDWTALRNKQMIAPFVPSQGSDNYDYKQANGIDLWVVDNEAQLYQNGVLLRNQEY